MPSTKQFNAKLGVYFMTAVCGQFVVGHSGGKVKRGEKESASKRICDNSPVSSLCCSLVQSWEGIFRDKGDI
mgnify:CR=1 FL=1